MIYFKDANNQVHAFDDDVVCQPYMQPDFISITAEEASAIANPPKTADQLMAIAQIAITTAIQNKLDTTAQVRTYDDIKSACAYASPIPFVVPDNATPDQLAITALQEKQRIEGNALQAWMSLSWAMLNHYYASVKSGVNSMPTPDEAVAMMPTFTWPD